VRPDREVIEALAAGKEKLPVLASVFELHQKLREAQAAVKAGWRRPSSLVDEGRLANQEPLLSFDDLGVDAESLGMLARRIVAVVVEYGYQAAGDEAERAVSGCLAEARNWFESRLPPVCETGNGTSIPRVVAAYSLVPWLEQAAEYWQSQVDISQWRRPYCPMCGGLPDLALLRGKVGERFLACSRCSTLWRYVRLGCPFCDSSTAEKMQYFEGAEKGDRLYVCQDCGAYLKTLDVRERFTPVILQYERVRTIPLDLAARREGYHYGGLMLMDRRG